LLSHGRTRKLFTARATLQLDEPPFGVHLRRRHQEVILARPTIFVQAVGRSSVVGDSEWHGLAAE
jgi:hypothetical protein